MQTVTAMIIPVIIGLIIVTGLCARTDVFSEFLVGAKDGLSTIYSIAPSLIGLVTAVSMFRASGALDAASLVLEPLASVLGVPSDVMPLFLLKPVSGSGSLALFEQIVADNGGSSLAAKAAAIMTGSTETTFYCTTVYYAAAGVKKTGSTIPCALLGDLAGMVTACITAKCI